MVIWTRSGTVIIKHKVIIRNESSYPLGTWLPRSCFWHFMRCDYLFWDLLKILYEPSLNNYGVNMEIL